MIPVITIRKEEKIKKAPARLSRIKAVIFHLYPGVFIALGFMILAPLFMRYGFPPQFGSLIAIAVVAVPLLLLHLNRVKKQEGRKHITELNGFSNKIPTVRLILYSAGLVIFAFIIWGITQPSDVIITKIMLRSELILRRT